MFSSAKAEEEPAWTGFAMEQIMKTLSFVNSSLVQAPREEKEKLAHKLDDTLYCAKVRDSALLRKYLFTSLSWSVEMSKISPDYHVNRTEDISSKHFPSKGKVFCGERSLAPFIRERE